MGIYFYNGGIRPRFNWKELGVKPEEAKAAKDLVQDIFIVTTFLDALDKLKEERRKRTIELDEFVKGLIEIISAIEYFIQYENSFTDIEINLQIGMLEKFIEVSFIFLKQIDLDKEHSFEEEYRKLREKYKKGSISTREYWKNLIVLSVKILKFIHNSRIDPILLRFLLSAILAIADYYQCVLILKRELVEDFAED